jgi:DNA-binding transcriptional LysR family regulator
MQGRWLEFLPQDLGAAGWRDLSTGGFVPAICVDSFAAMVAAVRNGRAVSAAPPAFIRDEFDRGELVTLPLEEPWPCTPQAIAQSVGPAREVPGYP